jgi:arylsulfatase A-like enzyme
MLSRKKALGLTVVGVTLMIFGIWSFFWRPRVGGHSAARPSPGASLLLITLDTTRADHIGAIGGEDDLTPNLDALAARGVTFTQAQTTAPITLVAHTSILTGLYPYHHGVRNNGTFQLSDTTPTLATVLRNEGYRTGAFVSAYVLARRYGLDRGFETYDDDLSRGRHQHAGEVPSRRADVTIDAP